MSKGIHAKFISHWWRAVVHGVSGETFGWGTALAALLLAAFVALGFPLKLGLTKMNQELPWWFVPLASVVFALIAVTAIHVFLIAPYRACRMLKPFKVRIASGDLETAYPKEQYKRQNVFAAIKNKSYREQANCTLHIMKVSDFNNEHNQFPRLVQEFSVKSGDEIEVAFLSRTLRTAPLENDKHLMLHGPVAPAWGGNLVTLPLGSYDMEIRIGVPGVEPILIPCRIRSDADSLSVV
jgi:hypothetical protein